MHIVLTYHRIVERREDVGDFFDVCVHEFEHHLEVTRAIWGRGLSPSELLNSSPAPSARDGFLITFDDGTIDHYTTAAPVLERHGMRGVFFVNPGELGLAGNMTMAQCRELQSRGHWIESHSHDHVILTHQADDELRRQLTESRRRLREEGLGQHEFMAVPGGFYDARVTRAAADAGYRLLRTLEWGYNRRDVAMRIESITMNQQTAGRYCTALLSPRGEVAKKSLYRAKELVKQTGPYLYLPLRNSGAVQFLRGRSRG